MEIVEQRRVVFVKDDHGFQTGFLVYLLNQFLEAFAGSAFGLIPFVASLVHIQLAVKFFDNLFHFPLVLAGTDVEMQHWVLLPVLFQFGDGKTLEQVFAALEVVFQGAAKQRLPESSRTAEEYELRFARQFKDKVCLVNVDASVLTDAFKIGDAGGVESHR